ncbi:MAG: DUF2007 domain-containing protein [Chloroflexi bacterium]|nr:DUF2007 domain-containing protein [Chloroflexota bacterium]
MKETLPVVVYVASGMLEAQVVKGRLEAEGIPAMLQYDSSAAVFPVTVDGIGEVRVLVPEHRAQRAREVLSETA